MALQCISHPFPSPHELCVLLLCVIVCIFLQRIPTYVNFPLVMNHFYKGLTPLLTTSCSIGTWSYEHDGCCTYYSLVFQINGKRRHEDNFFMALDTRLLENEKSIKLRFWHLVRFFPSPFYFASWIYFNFLLLLTL